MQHLRCVHRRRAARGLVGVHRAEGVGAGGLCRGGEGDVQLRKQRREQEVPVAAVGRAEGQGGGGKGQKNGTGSFHSCNL
jgi:hypothetical protein